MAEKIKAGYDAHADVLYMSVGDPDRRSRSCSDENGLIWRTAVDGSCKGVTVPNYRAWKGRPKELAMLLSGKLRLPKKVVAEQIGELA